MKKNSHTQTAFELGEIKLLSSGLDLNDADLLGIQILDGIKTAALNSTFKPYPSLKINYFDQFGKPLSDIPTAKPFYRLRYLNTPTTFDAITKKRPTRYVQLPNTAPVVYFPRNFQWAEFLEDADKPLIITEGEFKAAKACKEGFPTIGLGGVYNWRSRKLGIDWLPSLQMINWLRRNIYICFDSDYRSNPHVCHALWELAEELTRRGAFPHIVSLPQLPNLEKVGLDDFLVYGGPNSTEIFASFLANAEPLGLARPLFQLNEKYTYVQNPNSIIDNETFTKVQPGAFKEHFQVAHMYQERQLKPDGSISYQPISAAAAWIKWPLRSEVKKITYAPGCPRILRDVSAFNIWPGWGTEPKNGNVKPFLDLVSHLFTGAENEAKEWFLNWCAYPLQNPGVKMFSSAVFHGIRHGTGKSLVGYTLGAIYGKNFTEISQVDLHNSFNEWAEGKQFVLGDDVTGSDKRGDADFLKKLITQKELRVNPKYVPTYVVPDCINYFFTANHPDSFFLEDDDRRFFIHEIQVGPLPEEFYMDYSMWLDDIGPAALFHYLLERDTGGFNPSAPAFRTMAKERMIANVQSDLGTWVRMLRDAPDYILHIGDMPLTKDLFTAGELHALYDPDGRTKVTVNGMARELSKVGFRQVLDGRQIRLPDGQQVRVYMIRRSHHWIKAGLKEITEHIIAGFTKKRKKY